MYIKMAGIEFKVFRVEKVFGENFDEEDEDEEDDESAISDYGDEDYSTDEDLYPAAGKLDNIDWDVDNSVDATKMLYKICKIERRYLDDISTFCAEYNKTDYQNDDRYRQLDYWLQSEVNEYIKRLGSTNVDINQWCPLLDKKINAYQDVYRRDLLAFKQIGFNVDIHAVVLLYNGEYQGHVYIWNQPKIKQKRRSTEKKEKHLMVMGIRNRIDTIWNRDDSSLRNIALYLFEGVRLFADYLDLTKIAIVEPFAVIEQIVTKIGFVNSFVSAEIIGNSISEYSSTRKFQCYVSNTIDQPFIEGNFNLDIV